MSLFIFVFPLLSEEKVALDALKESIESYSYPCSCFRLQTTSEDGEVFSVNYYNGLYKALMKSPQRIEYEKRFGNKRKWIVSKNGGIGEGIFFVGAYTKTEEKFPVSKLYSLQFKNYCERDEKANDDYARVKAVKLIFFEAPFHFGNNGLQVRLDSPLKRTMEFSFDVKDFTEGNSILPAYLPKGTTTDAGSVFAVQMIVTEVYPGRKNKSLCVQDLNLRNIRNENKF